MAQLSKDFEMKMMFAIQGLIEEHKEDLINMKESKDKIFNLSVKKDYQTIKYIPNDSKYTNAGDMGSTDEYSFIDIQRETYPLLVDLFSSLYLLAKYPELKEKFTEEQMIKLWQTNLYLKNNKQLRDSLEFEAESNNKYSTNKMQEELVVKIGREAKINFKTLLLARKEELTAENYEEPTIGIQMDTYSLDQINRHLKSLEDVILPHEKSNKPKSKSTLDKIGKKIKQLF